MKSRTGKMSIKRQMKTNKTKQKQKKMRRRNSTLKMNRKVRNSRKHKQMKNTVGGTKGKRRQYGQPATRKTSVSKLSRSLSLNKVNVKNAMNRIVSNLVKTLLSRQDGSLMTKMKQFQTSYLFGYQSTNSAEARHYKLAENIMKINIDKVQDSTSDHHKAVVLWTYIRFLCNPHGHINLARAQTTNHMTDITKSEKMLQLTFGLDSQKHGKPLSEFLSSSLKQDMDAIDDIVNDFKESLNTPPVNVSHVNTIQRANSEPNGANDPRLESLRDQLTRKKVLFNAMIQAKKTETGLQRDMFDPNLLALYYYNKCKVSVYKFFEKTRGRIDDIKARLESLLTVENVIGTDMKNQVDFVTRVLTNQDDAIQLLTDYNSIIDDKNASDEEKQDATLSYGIVYGAHVMRRTLGNVVNSVSGVIQKFQEAEQDIQQEIRSLGPKNQTFNVTDCPEEFVFVSSEYPNLLSIVTIPSIRTLFLLECYDAYQQLDQHKLSNIPDKIKTIFDLFAPIPKLDSKIAPKNSAMNVFSGTKGHKQDQLLMRSVTM
jgi:hypothetical protein